jgi:hypothetical protein
MPHAGDPHEREVLIRRLQAKLASGALSPAKQEEARLHIKNLEAIQRRRAPPEAGPDGRTAGTSGR